MNTGTQDSKSRASALGRGISIEFCASYAEGGDLLREAFDQGITFWDTAEGYGSQPHLGAALKGLARDQVVIQTKTGALDYDGARKSIERSLREMGTDYIDVLLLHGVSSPEDLESRREPCQHFWMRKAKGLSVSPVARRTSSRDL